MKDRKRLSRIEALGGWRPWLSDFFTGVACFAVILILGAILFLVMMTASVKAEVLASPVVWPECLNRNVQVELEDLGAPFWVRKAADIVMDGNIGKGPVDVIEVMPGETALGWAHFHLERDRLKLNLSSNTPRIALLMLLYSDAAAMIQYRAFLRIVSPAVEESRYETDEDRALVAALASHAPTYVRRLGRTCRWDRECLIEEFATTPHRRRRVEAWRTRL
jgi:hypothetical protein